MEVQCTYKDKDTKETHFETCPTPQTRYHSVLIFEGSLFVLLIISFSVMKLRKRIILRNHVDKLNSLIAEV